VSRLGKVLLANLLIVLLLAIAGCGGQSGADQTDQATDLIDQAKTLTRKTDGLEKQMDELWPKIGKIDPAKDANDALAKLDDAEAGYAQMTKNQKSVAALYAKVAELDVGEMLRIWAGQQKAIAELSLQATAVLDEFVAKDRVLFSLWNQLDQADREKLIQELKDLDARSLKLRTRASKMRQASEQYYKDNGLGE